MTPVEKEGSMLREAAARGDFAAAEALAMRYAGLLRPLLAELPPAEAMERLREACELIDWSRRYLCDARARVAAEIQRLESLRRYHTRPPAVEYTFRVLG